MAGSSPLSFIVIDDMLHKSISAFSEHYTLKFFENAQINGFRSYDQALSFIKSQGALGVYPDVLVFDTYGAGRDWGFENAKAILQWFDEHAPSNKPQYALSNSSDAYDAIYTAERIKNELGIISSYAVDSKEAELAYNYHNNRFDVPQHTETDGFRRFVNDALGLKLPINQEELDALRIGNKNWSNGDLIRFIYNEKMAQSDALFHLKAGIQSDLKWKFKKEVSDAYIDSNTNSIWYKNRIGDPANGYAAFTFDDVNALDQQGKKAVLFIDQYTPDFVPHLEKMSGLVMLSAQRTGHMMKQVLEPHDVSGLLGQPDISEHYPYLIIEDELGQPTGNAQKITIVDGEHCLLDYTGAIEEVAHQYKGQYKDAESVPIKTVKLSDLTPAMIKVGDEVTIDEGHEVHTGHHQIKDPDEYPDRDLLKAQKLLKFLHAENKIKFPKFKANINSVKQSVSRAYGIGLLRTERLILEDDKQRAAFTTLLTSAGELAGHSFEEAHSQSLQSFWNSQGFTEDDENFKCRIRLVDAPPAEFVSNDVQDQIGSIYGDRDIRGVQLAHKLPCLYEFQLTAIFNSVGESRKTAHECEQNLTTYFSAIHNKPEILVPNVRSEEEILFVKSIAQRTAEKTGWGNGDYRFGSMLETVDACQNIEKIAPHCAFLSIGTNDLTKEVLNIKRDDWEARHAYLLEHGVDPFVKLAPVVAQLIQDTVRKAREVHPDIEVDLCGDHAEDLDSLMSLIEIELDGVSVTPKNQYLLGHQLLYGFESLDYYHV